MVQSSRRNFKRWLVKPIYSLFNKTVLRLSNYLLGSARLQFRATTIKDILIERAKQQSADYVEQRMPSALCFNRREELWEYALQKVSVTGTFAEFGVWKGNSINWFARNRPQEKWFGFDSFEGLSEDWAGWELSKGAFNLHGRLPVVEHNVELIKGWFDQTIPAFLARSEPSGFSFIHLDSDTYGAAKCVLNLIKPHLQMGTVIIFDEYFGYPGWRQGEFLAWREFVDYHKLTYEYLGFSNEEVAVRLL